MNHLETPRCIFAEMLLPMRSMPLCTRPSYNSYEVTLARLKYMSRYNWQFQQKDVQMIVNKVSKRSP